MAYTSFGAYSPLTEPQAQMLSDESSRWAKPNKQHVITSMLMLPTEKISGTGIRSRDPHRESQRSEHYTTEGRVPVYISQQKKSGNLLDLL